MLKNKSVCLHTRINLPGALQAQRWQAPLFQNHTHKPMFHHLWWPPTGTAGFAKTSLKVWRNNDKILPLLVSQQMKHKFCIHPVYVQIASKFYAMIQMIFPPYHANHRRWCHIFIHMNKFLDSHHIIICFASRKISWMNSIYRSLNFGT